MPYVSCKNRIKWVDPVSTYVLCRPNSKRRKIRDKTGGRCSYCGKPLTQKNWSIDHIVPKSKGGTYDLSNLVPCCKGCNNSKGAMPVGVFVKNLRNFSMKNLTELEKDVNCVKECIECGNFVAFRRVFSDYEKYLKEFLATGDAENVLQMKVAQNTLKIIETLLEVPKNLGKDMDLVCQRKANMPKKVDNIQRKREMMV